MPAIAPQTATPGGWSGLVRLDLGPLPPVLPPSLARQRASDKSTLLTVSGMFLIKHSKEYKRKDGGATL
jgi:hypothetical protein